MQGGSNIGLDKLCPSGEKEHSAWRMHVLQGRPAKAFARPPRKLNRLAHPKIKTSPVSTFYRTPQTLACSQWVDKSQALGHELGPFQQLGFLQMKKH